MNQRFIIFTLFLGLFHFQQSFGALKKEMVSYKEGATDLEGYLVYDDAVKTPRPAVIVVHDWMGMGDYVKMRADQLANMGYVAFAVDIYGKGNLPKDVAAAGKIAGSFKSDRKLLRARAKAAYDFILKNKMVDAKKMAAIGYCFGGTTVLEMARAGLPLQGVISFHGGLDNPNVADVKNIKAKVLVNHGAIDPYVKKEEVDQFMKEMNEANIDYQFISYSGAVHAFTEKHAGNDISKGAAYNASADLRSFKAMKVFFAEIF